MIVNIFYPWILFIVCEYIIWTYNAEVWVCERSEDVEARANGLAAAQAHSLGYTRADGSAHRLLQGVKLCLVSVFYERIRFAATVTKATDIYLSRLFFYYFTGYTLRFLFPAEIHLLIYCFFSFFNEIYYIFI